MCVCVCVYVCVCVHVYLYAAFYNNSLGLDLAQIAIDVIHFSQDPTDMQSSAGRYTLSMLLRVFLASPGLIYKHCDAKKASGTRRESSRRPHEYSVK